MPRFQFGMKDNPAIQELRKLNRDAGKRTSFSVVSLFSGCGGFDLGLLGGFQFLDEYYPRLPFSIQAAYDIDEKAIETYNLNLGGEGIVRDLANCDISSLPSADVMTGGFPCQDFSSCGPKTGFDGKRGRLYEILVAYMAEHQPRIVVGENVPHLARLSSGSLIETILRDFESTGYKFNLWVLYCPHYGLPQNRTRLFFVGVRNDIAQRHGMPSEPEHSHLLRHVSIDQAINDLELITDEQIPNQSQYFVATKATAGAGQGDQTNRAGEVAYAMRANPKARIHFHHKLKRRLTVRECARLQSFPDAFVFPFATSTNVMQIGNAVPPIIGHAVGKEIAKFLKATRGQQGTRKAKLA